MIAYRQRGLANVYALFANIFAVALVPIYSVLLPSLTYVALSESVNLLPYCAAVFVGMAASSGLIRGRTTQLTRLSTWSAFGIALRQTGYVAGLMFTYTVLSKDQAMSRLFLGSYLVWLTIGLTLMHARMPGTLAQLLFSENNKMPTLFIGHTSMLDTLNDWITNRQHLGIQPVGFLSDEEPSRLEKMVAPYIGRIDDLGRILQERRIAQVILLDWMDDTARVEHMIELCEAEGCRFLIHNNYGASFARTFIPMEEGGHHFMTLQQEPLEDPLNRALKRLLDILVSLPVVLFVLPPLCLLVWLVQRRQAPGPLFFNNPRGGQNRRMFKMLKFRSMYAIDHDINKQACSGDSRIYPFGKFLRKSSLDEIPQFLNVLGGSMSVVGPRPHLPKHDDEFSAIARSYRIRSLVKPGITGLAQVRGFRGEITDPEKLHRRVYWDLYYVTNWSFWLDLKLIFQTAWQVFVPPDTAY
ncbi:MAG: exopolysaccharide biosynthesis polyprenyl glycosylphosphotransferase [Verrucomicrobiota bacterium]